MSASRDYAFRAIDRPLSEADRNALRALSTRATITLTRFVDTDPWGDFEADPAKRTQATGLLWDLKGLAAERGRSDAFDTRLSGLL